MSNKLKAFTREQLAQDILEMYQYYFQEARTHHAEEQVSDDYLRGWAAGKADGGAEAMGALMLQVYGGKKLFELWIREISREDVPDEG